MLLGDIVLKADRIGRVKTPRDRQELILAEFDRSGMSGIGFARHYGIKYPTFAAWVAKRRKNQTGEPSVTRAEGLRFVEAVVDPVNAAFPKSEAGLRVELPGGAHLEMFHEGQAVPFGVRCLFLTGKAVLYL